MISQIAGRVVGVSDNRVEIVDDSLTYEVLVPACDAQRLTASVGQSLRFHTLHYLEGQGQGTSFIPRLIGFQTPGEREFFELFTTVKGIGYRKALRALQLPFSTVAEAIARKDTDLLVGLPEIGKRTAETIVAELRGKVDRFAVGASSSAELKPDSPGQRLMRDAVAALVQLGEPRALAVQLVDRALAADPSLDSADQVLAAAYRLRESV